MQLLMQVISPFGAVGHIVDNAFISYELACAAFACVMAQFEFSDDANGYWRHAEASEYWRNPIRQTRRELINRIPAEATAPIKVPFVRRPVRASAGTVVAKATGTIKVSAKR